MSAKNVRILFAEDDNATRKVMLKLLQTYGYEVVEAINGRDAIEKFVINPGMFDVIITDFSMPIMNGFAFGKEVKRTRSNIPVVLYSGFGARNYLSENGMDHSIFSAVLIKPSGMEHLRETIEFVMQGGYVL